VPPRLVRWAVGGVCAGGIAGMIVASVLDAQGAILTFGLLTACAVACLMVATAVSGAAREREAVSDEQGAAVEELVQDLVARGADETAVRRLVREASQLRGPKR